MTFANSVSASDRRDSPRRTCRLRASIAPAGQGPLAGVTIDIGRDGMAMLLDMPLPTGQTCDISFTVFAKGAVQRVAVKAQALTSVFVRDAVRVSFSFMNVGVDAQRVLTEFVSFGATR